MQGIGCGLGAGMGYGFFLVGIGTPITRTEVFLGTPRKMIREDENLDDPIRKVGEQDFHRRASEKRTSDPLIDEYIRSVIEQRERMKREGKHWLFRSQ